MKERLWSIRSKDKDGNSNLLRIVDEKDLGDTLLEMILDEAVFDVGIRGVLVG